MSSRQWRRRRSGSAGLMANLFYLPAVLLSFLSALFVCLPAHAKSYAINSLDVQAQVQPDGSVLIEEELAFAFKGKFSFAYRDIPLGPGHRLEQMAVSERGSAFRESDSEEPGTFQVSRSDRRMRVNWYYRARNEERQFRLKYIFHGAVARHEDVAEFYMKFVGDQWDRSIGAVNVTVRLPEPVPADRLQAWVHGPLSGEVQPFSGGSARFHVAPLPARTFWEGRVLFPPAAVAAMPDSGRGVQGPAIRAQEAAWALEANRLRDAELLGRRQRAETRVWQQQWASRLWPPGILLALAGLTVWFMIWRSYGRPYPVAPISVPGEVPSKHPPAMVARLLTGTVGAAALVATLLDLARRGHYSISEKQVTRGGFWGRTRQETDYVFTATGKGDELLPLEQELVAFVHGLVGEHRTFSMSRLKKAAAGQTGKLRRWFESWRRQIGRRARAEGLLEPTPVRPMVLNALCGVVIAGAGLTISLVTRSPAGLPAIGAGLIQLILTATLTRQTADGRRLYLAWKAFKNHVRQLSRKQGPVSLTPGQWERYLIYAVIFDLHKPLGEVLERSFQGQSAALFPWYVGATGRHGVTGMTGFADGISTMVGSVTSTMSSVTGAGGGASVGGGGGAGGGGGGAG